MFFPITGNTLVSKQTDPEMSLLWYRVNVVIYDVKHFEKTTDFPTGLQIELEEITEIGSSTPDNDLI